ncbi:polysaccharide deacetylase family protein [Bacillus sp. JCM 19046]|nr:polysaccharide deacetylase family protein [Bacillus sp. JCM 19045]GAF17883.1 polysaccharide deacetylase family protein [Bacillus sp. JCM 19046]
MKRLTYVFLSCCLILPVLGCSYTQPESSQALHRKNGEPNAAQGMNHHRQYEKDSIYARSSISAGAEGRLQSKGMKHHKHVVALTFNDGPIQNETDTLLDLLKELHVKATFFVVGNQIEGNESTIKRMVADGHRIGNHSFTHQNLTELTISEIKEEISKTDDLLAKAVGIRTDMVRAPYGLIPIKAKKWLANNQYHLIGWDADYTSREEIDRLENGTIMLFHEGKHDSIADIQTKIETLKSEGYTFVTVPELFQTNGLK